jgi:hypothetical protein
VIQPALDAALAQLAAAGATTTYGALAEQLLTGPGRIARLTAALEATMEQDARAGQPLRASLVVARLGDGLPARGYFQKARELGLYAGPDTGPEARSFHALHLRAFTGA